MARRRRGRPVHGWLVLDKPAGVTSAQAVAKARRVLDAQKAGHAGTLDPDATGLLAIALGEATKTVPFIAGADKTYRFTLRWGAATTTDDAAGAVTATSGLRPEPAEIRAALGAFTGDILQIPPQVSAVKVAGERAYVRARAGERMELSPRPLHVAWLDLVECPDADSAVFEMTCGKGGYVRSIGRDLGVALGCLAHVTTLRRLNTGPFDLSRALLWTDLDASREEVVAGLLPLETALDGLPALELDTEAAGRVTHGNTVAAGPAPDGPAWARSDGRPMAIGRIAAGLFHSERVFVLD